MFYIPPKPNIENNPLKIRQWAKRFDQHPFEIDDIQSLFLKDSQKFKEIKSFILSYNEEIKKYELLKKEIPFGPLRREFYHKLVNLAREIVLTTNPKVQQSFIDKTHCWASEQIRLFSVQLNPKFERTAISTLEKKHGEDIENQTDLKRLLTQTNFNSIPSNQIEGQLKDYRINARTIHQSVEPPEQRLKLYQRRIVMPREIILKKLKDPASVFPSVYVQQKIDESPKNTLMQMHLSDQLIVENQKVETQESNQTKKSKNKLKNQVKIQPQIKTFLTDKKEFFQAPLIEEKSIYENYAPSKNIREISVEKRWFEEKNRMLRQKKEDEELLLMMKFWSNNKGRVEKEINRRVDSKFYGNEYQKTSFPSDPFQSLDISVIEGNQTKETVKDFDIRRKSRTLSFSISSDQKPQILSKSVDYTQDLPTIKENNNLNYKRYLENNQPKEKSQQHIKIEKCRKK